MNKTRSRELALQILFQCEYEAQAVSFEQRLEYFKSSFEPEETLWSYTCDLVSGIDEHKTEIDQKITSHSNNWSLSRMAKVDLNVMRIAIFEALYLKKVPPKVALNEAIEISKKYGSNDSAAFVNGVLDQIIS